MAGSDDFCSESFLDELREISEYLEAAKRNENFASELSKPETQHRESQLNSSLEIQRNFSTIGFLSGQQITSPPETPLNIESNGNTFAVSSLDSKISENVSVLEFSEESHDNSFLLQVETSRGNFWEADGYLDSISSSLAWMQKEEYNAEAQKTKDGRQFDRAFLEFNQIGDTWSSEISTNSAVLGSVADVEAVTAAEHSRIQRECHETGNKTRFVGDVCEKDFVENQDLEMNKKTRTGKKHFPCRICSKAFSQKGSLAAHLRTHSGEKPYTCHVCSKGFSHESNLVAHLWSHSGEKPNSCHICSKGFYNRSNLVNHLRTHLGEKPHTCLVCSKGFSQKSKLVAHLRTHSGEKRHTCHICNKGFFRKTTLEAHFLTHEGEEPFQ